MQSDETQSTLNQNQLTGLPLSPTDQASSAAESATSPAVGAPNSPSDQEPATAKQLAFLSRLGAQIPEHLSKREASILIDRALGQNVLHRTRIRRDY
jgi:hypothetical protein